MAGIPSPHIRLQTGSKKPEKESSVSSWVLFPWPRVIARAVGLVGIQLKSRHGVLTDHLTPDQARELGEFLLQAAGLAEGLS